MGHTGQLVFIPTCPNAGLVWTWLSSSQDMSARASNKVNLRMIDRRVIYNMKLIGGEPKPEEASKTASPKLPVELGRTLLCFADARSNSLSAVCTAVYLLGQWPLARHRGSTMWRIVTILARDWPRQPGRNFPRITNVIWLT